MWLRPWMSVLCLAGPPHPLVSHAFLVIFYVWQASATSGANGFTRSMTSTACASSSLSRNTIRSRPLMSTNDHGIRSGRAVADIRTLAHPTYTPTIRSFRSHLVNFRLTPTVVLPPCTASVEPRTKRRPTASPNWCVTAGCSSCLAAVS